MQLDRTNTSLLGKWWWTVDRPTLFGFLFLMLAGMILVMAGSPAVATRIGADSYHFIERHIIFLLLGGAFMFGLSLLEPVNVRRLAVIGLSIGFLLLAVLPFIGMEVKGATRWLSFGGMSVQPSEFVKPCFSVVTAWLFAESYRVSGFPGKMIGTALYMLLAALLAMQPDVGMTITVTLIWGGQLFLAGTSYYILIFLMVLAVVSFVSAYLFFPHVAKRIDSFLDPKSVENFQVTKSLEAFQQGGIFGVGPGEGTVKKVIPDAHTDFIFAVAGEEFGAIACLIIIGVFAFIILRGFFKIWHEKDLFIILAVAGLLFQFGVQALINIGVALNLLPTKGMTLPFVSYGGSSTLAFALGMGMLLALTRRRYGNQSRM